MKQRKVGVLVLFGCLPVSKKRGLDKAGAVEGNRGFHRYSVVSVVRRRSMANGIFEDEVN